MNSSFSFRNTSMRSSSSFNSSFSSSRNDRRQTVGEVVVMSEHTTHLLEKFGSTLPAMVRVALNKADDARNLSFRLDKNGWAWLVWKHQIYIWRFTTDARRSLTQCQELPLPPSVLFHNAKLVTVLVTASGFPACLAVSPEGHITYWPNIYNESATISINADLPGQECDSLTSAWPMGCILTTTTASILLVKTGVGAKPSLTCVNLNCESKAWFGGLSKTMSFLVAMGSPAIKVKRASVAVPYVGKETSSRHSANVYVLAGTDFQVWSLSSEGQNCTFDVNLDDIVRKEFHRAIWEGKGDPQAIQIWLLDMRAEDPKKVRILATCLNRTEPNALLSFGILTFDGSTHKIQDTVEFKHLAYRCGKIGEDEALYVWKLLPTPTYSFVVSHDRILIVGEDASMDSIVTESCVGSFIGSGLSAENYPLVFTTKLGLVSLRFNRILDTPMLNDTTIGDLRIPDHLSLSATQHAIHDLSLSEDKVNRYKSAFLNFCGKRVDECMEILNGLFPPQAAVQIPNDSVNIWTVVLCDSLVDGAPMTDPRMSASAGHGDVGDPLGIRSKMLIKNFLSDKKKGLEVFFSFLRATGISSQLSGYVVKDDVQATVSVLYNSYEKIAFATALHYLQTDNRYRKILDPGIKSIVALRQESRLNPPGLSFNDMYFKDISYVHQILTALVHMEEDVIGTGEQKSILEIVSLTTEVILVLFAELQQLVGREFSQVRQSFLKSVLESPIGYAVSPWYIQPPCIEALTKQVTILVSTNQLLDSEDDKIDLFKQLEQLVDIILDGLRTEMESLKGSQRYIQKNSDFAEKRALFLSHLEEMDAPHTIPLAEKYLDFNLIVRIHYQHSNMEELGHYFDKYSDLEFPTIAFEWFLKQKKDVELLNFFSTSKYAPLLGEFLKNYPDIYWHHATRNDNFDDASKTLTILANAEELSLQNQKFLFGLSKLSLLASETESEELDQATYNELNRKLSIIKFQNSLPDEALSAHGYDREDMPVLSPSQVIDLYTSSQIIPDYINFWNAICIVQLLRDAREEKRLLIVARAILCEPWNEWEIEHPLDSIVPSVLYKLLAEVKASGQDVKEYFNLEELRKLDILKAIFESGNTQYLLKACYELLTQDDDELMC